jgi:hypothetical protein
MSVPPSDLSVPTSTNSYLGHQQVQARLAQVGTRYFAPTTWPRGYQHVADVMRTMEAVHNEDRELYNPIWWDVL